jgi:hypothetical protein
MPTSAVMPVLFYPDVGKASRWLCEAFELRLMIANHRAQLTGHPLSWSASMMYRSGTA